MLVSSVRTTSARIGRPNGRAECGQDGQGGPRQKPLELLALIAPGAVEPHSQDDQGDQGGAKEAHLDQQLQRRMHVGTEAVLADQWLVAGREITSWTGPRLVEI